MGRQRRQPVSLGLCSRSKQSGHSRLPRLGRPPLTGFELYNAVDTTSPLHNALRDNLSAYGQVGLRHDEARRECTEFYICLPLSNGSLQSCLIHGCCPYLCTRQTSEALKSMLSALRAITRVTLSAVVSRSSDGVGLRKEEQRENHDRGLRICITLLP